MFVRQYQSECLLLCVFKTINSIIYYECNQTLLTQYSSCYVQKLLMFILHSNDIQLGIKMQISKQQISENFVIMMSDYNVQCTT